MKKRLVVFLLVIALSCTTVGGNNVKQIQAQEGEIVLGETSRSCVFRKQPYKDAEVVAEIPEETLVYLEGVTNNNLGHQWMEVQYLGETVYCYSENIKSHEHIYDISIDEDSEEEVYACKCGAIQEESNGLTNTFVPAVAVPAIAEGVKELLIVAGIYVGFRTVGKHVLPIIVTEAGSVVTITKEMFENLKNEKEEEQEQEDKKYYKARILTKNEEDSLELIDYGNPLSLDQACDYVDSLLSIKGAYGYIKRFSVNACNIYTPNEEDAVQLCEQVRGCTKNKITEYGNSKGVPQIFDIHSARFVNGSYFHYHLFELNRKSVVHILYGNPISLIRDIPEI